jgi:hypothetical protein
MNRIVVRSRVGSDGTLQLALPLGPADAGREVQITVEPVGPLALSPDEWRRRVLETAGNGRGSWSGPSKRRGHQ